MFQGHFSAAQIISGALVLAGVITFLLVGQLKYTFMIEYGVQILNISGSSFHYNLWGSLSKLWDEQLYFLYTFLFLFSGIWPFFKLLLLTGCILYNPTGVPLGAGYNMKTKYAKWIALLGIWSFADIWVVVMISIVLNDHKTINIDADTSVTATLQVTPLDGVVILFFGLFLSQLINILVIYWLKSLSSRTSESLGKYAHLSTSLRNGGSDSDDQDDSGDDESDESDNGNGKNRDAYFVICKRLTKNFWCQVLYNCLYVVLCVFFVVGMFCLPLYKIKYTVMKKYTSVSTFTVFSGIMHLKKIIDDNNSIEDESTDDNGSDNTGQYFLFVISVVFVIALPLLQQALIFMLWCLPSSSSSSTSQCFNNPLKALALSPLAIKRLYTLLDEISHFSSLEVFLLSSLFVSYELGSLLKNLALGKYLSIEISLSPGFYIYFVCVALLGGVKYGLCASQQHQQQLVDDYEEAYSSTASTALLSDSMTNDPAFHHHIYSHAPPSSRGKGPHTNSVTPVGSRPLMSEYARGHSIVL